MSSAMWLLGISCILFIGYGFFLALEQKRGNRLVASAIRLRLDNWCDDVLLAVITFENRLSIRFAGIWLWRQSALWLLALYAMVDEWGRRSNYDKVVGTNLANNQTSTHLSAVADHKAETALTAVQKRRLKKQAMK